MKTVARVCLLITLCGFALSWAPARATVIHKSFIATLTNGPLGPIVFPGTFSYDTSGLTGVGVEYLPLASLDFTLKGVLFTRADIKQGGQAVFDNGALSYFTAAFFPPPPLHSPVPDIAFGFGGPGVIGYFTGTEFGSGQYVIGAASVAEPGTAAVLAFGLLAFLAAAGRRRVRALAGR